MLAKGTFILHVFLGLMMLVEKYITIFFTIHVGIHALNVLVEETNKNHVHTES